MQLILKAREDVGSLSERTSLSLLIACAVFLILLLFPEKQLNDGDTLWHIVLGQHMLTDGRLPEKDDFSFTFPDAPYQTNSWLSDVLLAAAYNLGGFAAVVILSSFCVALTFFLLQQEQLTRLSPKISIYFGCPVFLLLSPHILSRPHVLAFPLVALWTIVLLRAEERQQPPPMAALLILFLWVNIHGSFLLAFAVTTPIVLFDVFRDGAIDRSKARDWVPFLLGMVAVTLIGPYGLGPLKTAFSVLSVGPLLSSIQEWRPENFSSFGSFEAVLLVTLGVLTYGGVKLSLARMTILLGLLHMALSHTRNSDYLAIIGAIVLASPVALTMREDGLFRHSKIFLTPAFAVVVLATLSTLLFRTVVPPNATYPFAAIRAARATGAQGNVFNDYGFGGALIFDGVKVFVDSRAEFYPRAFLQDYLDLLDQPDEARLEAFFTKNAIQWTILDKDKAAAALIGRLPGWREVYRDDAAIAHVRSVQERN